MPSFRWNLLVHAFTFSVLLVGAHSNLASYAPTIGACPSDVTFVRTFSPSNQTIHASETSYINARSSVVSQSWKAWLGDGSQLGYDLDQFTAMPKLAISLSGGGARAALYGAGVLEALDGRNVSSVSAGTGGLLQVASYIAGLSGGSWLTASLTFNNYPEIRSLVMGDSKRSGWMLDLDIVAPGGFNIFNTKNQQYYRSVLSGITEKQTAGFQISVADIWARFVSHHFLDQKDTTRDNFFMDHNGHGAGLLWSQISQLESFRNHNIPFPLVLTDSRPSWSNSAGLQNLDSPVFEISPFEMGSYDPSLSAMVNITYAGTHFIDGRPANNTACVTGFDQAGFVIGTSSTPFNAILDVARQRFTRLGPIPFLGLVYLLRHTMSQLAQQRIDVANWPNPFQSSTPTTFRDYNSSMLDLVDGSENWANIPLGPLFLKARSLDVIVTVDGSSDFENNDFTNGSALLYASERLRSELAQTHRQFPPIPKDSQEMVDTGVVFRPTFFGCNPTQDPPEWPLVIYLPNSPPLNGDSPVTNTPTFKVSYTPKHASLSLDQAHNLTVSGFTPGSQDPDSAFGRCLQCAAVDRARLNTMPPIIRSDFCFSCFDRYCYDPKRPPSARDIVGRTFIYKDPDPQGLALIPGFLVKHKAALIFVTVILLLVLSVAAIFFCMRFIQKIRKERQWARYDAARDEEEPYSLKFLSRSTDSINVVDRFHSPSSDHLNVWRPGLNNASTSSLVSLLTT